jgi:hypothetical protein
MFEDCKFIKSRLFKALRLAIRKVKTASADLREFGKYTGFLNMINNDRIKKILVSPDALTARIALCDFYISKNLLPSCIEKAILLMEAAIGRIERRRGDKDDDLDDL